MINIKKQFYIYHLLEGSNYKNSSENNHTHFFIKNYLLLLSLNYNWDWGYQNIRISKQTYHLG